MLDSVDVQLELELQSISVMGNVTESDVVALDWVDNSAELVLKPHSLLNEALGRTTGIEGSITLPAPENIFLNIKSIWVPTSEDSPIATLTAEEITMTPFVSCGFSSGSKVLWACRWRPF